MVRFPVIESVDQEGAAVAGGGGGTTSAVPPGWFQPETYGAIGDGTTDDTAAINACLAAAKAYAGSTTGATVFFTKSSYKTTGPVNCDNAFSGLRLLGSGGRLQWSEGPTISFAGSGTALTTLNGAITAGQTTITVHAAVSAAIASSGSYAGVKGQFAIKIDSEELYVVSGADTLTWSVRRGWNNSTAAIHADAASVLPFFPAISAGSIGGFTMENLRVQYTDATFVADLVNIDWSTQSLDPTNWSLIGCALRGNTGVSGARSLVRLNHAIIGTIERCHFGERNGPGIMCGDGNYCVAVQIRDNTWNSGAAGTYCVQTNGGAEAILIEGNTFEAVAGTHQGAWQHTAGVAWHVTFRDNWMGDQSSQLFPWIDVQGQLNSFVIEDNRFTAFGVSDVLINFESGSVPQGGRITGNWFDAVDATISLGASFPNVIIYGNTPVPVINRNAHSVGGAIEESSVGTIHQAGSARPALGLGGTTVPSYTLDVNEQSGVGAGNTKGIRLLSGGLYFGGTAGNQDAAYSLTTYNLIGLYAKSTAGALALPASGATPSPANLTVGDAAIFVSNDGGTLHFKVAGHGSSVSTGPNFVGNYLIGTTTWNPASVANGAITTTTITVTGAVVGQPVSVGFPLLVSGVAATAGLTLTGQVSAASTVTVVLRNDTGGAVDLDSGTLEALVWQH